VSVPSIPPPHHHVVVVVKPLTRVRGREREGEREEERKVCCNLLKPLLLP